MTTTWNDVKARRPLDPDGERRVDSIKRVMSLQVALHELRTGRDVTQVALAERLGVSQRNVSRIENEDDIRLSTLQRFVEALGGRVEIHAVVGDEDITLTA